MSLQGKDELLHQLEQKKDEFEHSLLLFTTGDKQVKVKHIEANFRDMKKAMTHLRQIALENSDD
jgi:hypothetical protein